mmetsp:Transcript_17216/g.57033  ORF Transcript_17216/g.57033 Transcript_17216/m.57033 type:complete len:231 (+) Transcript_17216:525-1217(+)
MHHDEFQLHIDAQKLRSQVKNHRQKQKALCKKIRHWATSHYDTVDELQKQIHDYHSRYVRPEHISQDQNSNIKTAFSLLAHTMCENFKSMPLEDRRDFIRSILEEHESLEESNDESPTAKCFLTICHVERAMDNLRSAELPDIVSDVVMFASQEGDGMKSKHQIMPFIVSDWIRQGFRTKDTRGMRYSQVYIACSQGRGTKILELLIRTRCYTTYLCHPHPLFRNEIGIS